MPSGGWVGTLVFVETLSVPSILENLLWEGDGGISSTKCNLSRAAPSCPQPQCHRTFSQVESFRLKLGWKGDRPTLRL